MINCAQAVSQARNRHVVGDINHFGRDAGVVVGLRELGPVAAGDDDSRTLGPRAKCDGTPDPAPPPDDLPIAGYSFDQLVCRAGVH